MWPAFACPPIWRGVSEWLLQEEPHRASYVVTVMLAKSKLVYVCQTTKMENLTEWLIRTGVAVRVAHGKLGSGPRCELFADGEWATLGVAESFP